MHFAEDSDEEDEDVDVAQEADQDISPKR